MILLLLMEVIDKNISASEPHSPPVISSFIMKEKSIEDFKMVEQSRIGVSNVKMLHTLFSIKSKVAFQGLQQDGCGGTYIPGSLRTLPHAFASWRRRLDRRLDKNLERELPATSWWRGGFTSPAIALKLELAVLSKIELVHSTFASLSSSTLCSYEFCCLDLLRSRVATILPFVVGRVILKTHHQFTERENC